MDIYGYVFMLIYLELDGVIYKLEANLELGVASLAGFSVQYIPEYQALGLHITLQPENIFGGKIKYQRYLYQSLSLDSYILSILYILLYIYGSGQFRIRHLFVN